jgi:ElaB/YqjD/DUF883 family membrane-anchored ribosome-binding protein
MTSAITPAPPRTLAPVKDAAEARAQLAAARERLLQRLEVVEHTLEPLANWRSVVRRHPLLTIGGAFVVGYALARLFSRR